MKHDLSASGRSGDERGASSVEYGLIVVAIAALIAVVVFALGRVTNQLFAESCGTLQTTIDTSATC